MRVVVPYMTTGKSILATQPRRVIARELRDEAIQHACRRTGLLRFARNDDMQKHSRGALAPELYLFVRILAISRGERSAERRIHPMSARANKCAQFAPLDCARARKRAKFGARSPSGAPLRLSPGAFARWLSSRPCLLGRGSGGRYPLSPVPVQWQHPTPRP